MPPAPIVRHMLVCDDVRQDGPNNRRLTIAGLIWNIVSVDDPPYPLFFRELCVFLALTEGRGSGLGKIVCVAEDNGRPVFETPARVIPFPPDPLGVVGVVFRVQDCTFPRPGRYAVQFWYNGVLVEERPIQMR